ncbi:alpha/beta hydrolase [Aeoliella sp. SH292]|uniref:alpha/beta hydrolase n=1 Tax=Aeoliella sp. SH292 TaxID=3454464 RepID=UPI003F99E124
MAQDPILLWPDDHPANTSSDKGAEEVASNRLVIHDHPGIVPYLVDDSPTRAAVLIVPGGGYGVLAIDHEGTEVAKWLNERGINALILRYRCGGGKNGHPAPLDDARRGMKLIRANAEKWHVDPSRVGVIGFSAGGHLASSLSTMWDEGDASSSDPIERLSSRPDFSVLVYPVISMEDGVTHGGSRRNLLGESPDASLVEKMSTYKQVNDRTPPTFLAHATDDTGVIPENAIRYYKALVAAKVPAEAHFYEHGGHGFGMNTLKTKANRWLDDLEAWLKPRLK